MTGIDDVTDLAPKVRSFWQAACERAVTAEVTLIARGAAGNIVQLREDARDGVYVLVAESTNKRLSKFRVSDGGRVCGFPLRSSVARWPQGRRDYTQPTCEVIVADCTGID